MPSVYTIEGTRRRGRRRKKSGGRTAQQRRFASAAKKCKGKSRGQFRACMRQQLKR